jgi:hypothetical protein
MQKFQYPRRPLTKANSQFQLRIKADIAEFLPAAPIARLRFEFAGSAIGFPGRRVQPQPAYLTIVNECLSNERNWYSKGAASARHKRHP